MSAVPESDRLVSSEVDAVLRQFTAADWARAKSLARTYAAGLSGWTAEDLLHETLVKLLSGERTWRRGLHPLVVIATAMFGIASNGRKRVKNGPIDESTVVSTLVSNNADDSEPRSITVSDRTTPEDIIEMRMCLEAIEKAVEDDEDLGLLVILWAEGTRGEAAAKELGWDMRTYEATRKRLTRRLGTLTEWRRK